ncbi:hypothetical protein AAG906_011062 [Vitis piasezkii]
MNPTAIIGYLSGIEKLSGANFKKWKEQIGIVLGCMDLDYALREPTPTKPTSESTNEQKALYEKWERFNRMSLMIMKGSITPAIRGAILDSDNAMSYIKSVEEQFLGTSKSLASTLMIKMITMKYDGHSGVRDHIMKMSDMTSQLKRMDMAISEGFLVHFIMTSLPSQFGPFKINYNTQKDKWKMSELIAMCPDMAHLTIGPNKKSFKKGKGKKKSKVMMYLTMGKRMKIRYNVILPQKVDIPPNSWWIDIGVSIHITNSLQRYLTSKRVSKGERTITLGNGTEVEIEAIGTLRLILDTGFIMDLVDTVYVPIFFTRNLISVPRLDSYGYELKFGNNGVSLFYNSCLVGSGTLHEHRIIANYTMPGTPEQNALKTAVHILNRVPSKAIPKTPYELWGPKIVETRHAVLLENEYFSRRIELKKLTSNEVSIPMMEYGVTQEISRNENENVPTTEVSLRRSQREKRPDISNDYEVYLNECDYDVGLESDPTSYDQAINSENSTLWLYAMEEELKSMKDNEVWDLVELPKELKLLGNVERYKARLVAKGYTQKERIDYKEAFSPVSKKDSLRIVMALVAHFDLELHQMDIKTAFLNGDLHEEVYMDQPEGFQDKGKTHMTKQFLSKNFDMKDLGEASYVIGIEIHQDRSRGLLGLSPKNYIEKVLKRFNMQNCSSSVAPIVKGDIFCELQCPKNDLEKKQMDKIPYHVCSSLHSTRHSLYGLHAYIQKTNNLEIIGYFDFDYAGCKDTKKASCFDSIMSPLRIYCDNSAAVRFSKNNKTTGGSKHIDIKYLVVKEKVQNGVVSIEHIKNTLMLADPLTKGLPPKLFMDYVAHMGLVASLSILD